MYQKSLKIPKGYTKSVCRRRTDNTMAKRKSIKGQTTIYKTYILAYIEVQYDLPRAYSMFYHMSCKSFLIPNVCMNDCSHVIYDTQISHDSRLSIFLFIHSFQFLRSMLCKHFRLFI